MEYGTVRDMLSEIYLDWRNNYLSVAKFAEHNEITDVQAHELLQLARQVFYSKHPEE